MRMIIILQCWWDFEKHKQEQNLKFVFILLF